MGTCKVKRQDWLNWRRKGLGGSDAAAIRAGRGWSVWLAKTKGIDPDLKGEDIETGRRLEEPIAQWAATELGALSMNKGWADSHPEEPWRRATPDFWMWLPDEERGVEGLRTGLEAKVSPYPWDEIPQDFRQQCAWYMSVFDVDEWILAAFHRSAPAWRIYHLERDLDLEERLVDEMRAWWTKHVVNEEPPEIDGTPACAKGLSLTRDLPEDRGGRSGGFHVATPDEVALIASYIDTYQVEKRLVADRQALANQVRDAIGDRPGLRWSGGRIKWGKRLTFKLDT